MLHKPFHPDPTSTETETLVNFLEVPEAVQV